MDHTVFIRPTVALNGASVVAHPGEINVTNAALVTNVNGIATVRVGQGRDADVTIGTETTLAGAGNNVTIAAGDAQGGGPDDGGDINLIPGAAVGGGATGTIVAHRNLVPNAAYLRNIGASGNEFQSVWTLSVAAQDFNLNIIASKTAVGAGNDVVITAGDAVGAGPSAGGDVTVTAGAGIGGGAQGNFVVDATQLKPASGTALILARGNGTAWLTLPDTNIPSCLSYIVVDNNNTSYGDSSDSRVRWSTAQATAHSLLLTVNVGTALQGGNIIITADGNIGFDHGHGIATNPTVFIHSANASTTEWVSLSHDQTDAQMAVGAGRLVLGGTTVSVSNAFALAGTLSPTWAAQQDDLDVGNVTVVRATLTGAQTLTGLANGAAGRQLIIVNIDASDALTLANENVASAAANRILTGTGANMSVGAGQTVTLTYDAVASRWRVTGGSAAGGSAAGANTEIQFNNAGAFGASNNFTLNTGGAAPVLNFAGTSDNGVFLYGAGTGATAAAGQTLAQFIPNAVDFSTVNVSGAFVAAGASGNLSTGHFMIGRGNPGYWINSSVNLKFYFGDNDETHTFTAITDLWQDTAQQTLWTWQKQTGDVTIQSQSGLSKIFTIQLQTDLARNAATTFNIRSFQNGAADNWNLEASGSSTVLLISNATNQVEIHAGAYVELQGTVGSNGIVCQMNTKFTASSGQHWVMLFPTAPGGGTFQLSGTAEGNLLRGVPDINVTTGTVSIRLITLDVTQTSIAGVSDGPYFEWYGVGGVPRFTITTAGAMRVGNDLGAANDYTEVSHDGTRTTITAGSGDVRITPGSGGFLELNYATDAPNAGAATLANVPSGVAVGQLEWGQVIWNGNNRYVALWG